MRIMYIVFLLSCSPVMASTSVDIDAVKNCLTYPITDSADSSGVSAKFQIDPGRYNVSITSNNMNCNPVTCPIDTIIVQGGDNARWGTSVTTEPKVISISTTSQKEFVAYISDDRCTDNRGEATLTFEKIN